MELWFCLFFEFIVAFLQLENDQYNKGFKRRWFSMKLLK